MRKNKYSGLDERERERNVYKKTGSVTFDEWRTKKLYKKH
jgi:hypothetical protein